MQPNQFPTYPPEQLSAIYLNGIGPESMNYAFPCKHIKQKRFKEMLANDKDVFFASTRLTNPVFRFRAGQEIDIENPFSFEKRGKCIGHMDYLYRGFRMRGFLIQFID